MGDELKASEVWCHAGTGLLFVFEPINELLLKCYHLAHPHGCLMPNQVYLEAKQDPDWVYIGEV